ncbi:MAG: hypothetical protein AAB536_02295 [Patescibacteria group bacterium]
MNFALVYLIQRFFYRIFDFFHHWYADASKVFFHRFVSFLESLDRTIALRVTLRYFFQPLYKDYTVIGRILGVVFRSGRIIIGLGVYAFTAIIFLIIYALWLAAPIVLIFYVLGAK